MTGHAEGSIRDRGLKILVAGLRLVDLTSDCFEKGVAVLVAPMALALAFEVVSRYFFDAPTVWAQDISIFFFGYIGLLAGAGVMRAGRHINVDLVYGRLSRRQRAGADLLTIPLTLFFLGLVIVYMTEEGLRAIEQDRRRSTDWAPPVGHFYLAVAFGSFLLFLQALANWIRAASLSLFGREISPAMSDPEFSELQGESKDSTFGH